MKANDLRIGNLIHETISNLHGVVSLEILKIIEEKDNHSYKPILLTEEWLIKFGLLKTKERSYLLGCYELVKYEDVFRVLLSKNGILTSLKYVHQLQNLYFALTGNELST
ncbi:hypothetical protein KAR91_25555 [Candidatus Pacearchaeota archaeon]|nr:hypothetical protein [Candidatus Pacearchaeota archaeon]